MYTPDRWVIIKGKWNGETVYKVLAGWSGGYLEGQSWRINSGITKVTVDDSYYYFEGSSGSTYKCHKNGYGLNLIMGSIVQQIESLPDVVILEDGDFSNLLNE